MAATRLLEDALDSGRARSWRQNGVQLWIADLDALALRGDGGASLLSGEETCRAAAFALPRDRGRFIARRSLLRAIIGRALDTPPAAIVFVRTPYGRPQIAAPADPALSFSVSHSSGTGLFAVAQTRVGVDIEAIRDVPEAEAIARRFFAPIEQQALASLAPAERRRAFFRCWTRKEALVKADGRGLSCPLPSFGVAVAPHEPPRLIWSSDESWSIDMWMLADVPAADPFVASLAVQQHPAIEQPLAALPVQEPAVD